MLSLATLLVHTIKICKKQIRRYLNRRLFTFHSCDGIDCILDVDFSGLDCIIYGPRVYHSCVEGTSLGLLFRVLHYSLFDESDYGHVKALAFYQSHDVRQLYADLRLKLPHIDDFISDNLQHLPSNQYNLISRYIGYDPKIELIRKFHAGFFRPEKKEKKEMFPISFWVDEVEYKNSVLQKSLITFGGKSWRTIVSYSKPSVLDLFDIESIETKCLTLVIHLSDCCTIEIEDDGVMKNEMSLNRSNEVSDSVNSSPVIAGCDHSSQTLSTWSHELLRM